MSVFETIIIAIAFATLMIKLYKNNNRPND